MGMTYPYCNTTTDLQRVFKDIEKFQGIVTLSGFTLTSGQVNTYQKEFTGNIEKIFEDDIALTEKTSIADVELNAGSWFYDSTNDILYIHSSDSADPDTHTIKAGEDWDTLKTYMSERAFMQLESMLDPKYPRPLPFAEYQYNSFNYDSDIVEAAALLTCVNIIKYTDPDNPLAEKLFKRVWDVQEDGSVLGILGEYRQGLRAFTFEATKDEFGGNIEVVSRDASSTGIIYVLGEADDRYNINILIVTGGAVGKATFKYSIDNKDSYSSELTTSFQYIPIIGNLYLKFQGTFVVNDEFLIKTVSDPETVLGASIQSIKLKRD
jgi:hypothetical protein